MFRSLSRERRLGFTLVEVLVTTVVIGVLAAVVLPALARQTSAADPARVSSDLNNIKMGIEVFSNNLRPDYPGDLEDLVNAVSGADLALDGSAYANGTSWEGPYVAQTLSEFDGSATGATQWKAGAAGSFNNLIQLCDLTSAAPCTSVAANAAGSGTFVTVEVNNLSHTETGNINDILDGVGEANSSTSGMWRWTVANAVSSYYYTIPFVR